MKKDCTHCPKNGEIDLKYLGKSMCKPCFCRLVEKRIARTIRKRGLITRNDKIAIAVSGGKDSCLVLHFLHNYCKILKIPLLAIYADRDDPYSKNQLNIIKSQTKKLKIPLHVVSYKKELKTSMQDLRKIADKEGTNLCSVCGVMRRKLLNSKAKELGATKLATGHNLTDEAQTYLMNFIKNELKHFKGVSSPTVKGFIPRIKILRDVPENEIKLYCEIKKYDFLPTPCPCRIGSLRFSFQKILNNINEIRPGAEFAICSIGDKITEFAKKQYKPQKLNHCKKCGDPSSKDICRTCQYLN